MTKFDKDRYQARAKIIKAMAHPSRLFIVEVLSRKPMSVGLLTKMIEADISTVSKHLTVLKEAGIVSDKRDGTTIYYHLKMPCVIRGDNLGGPVRISSDASKRF